MLPLHCASSPAANAELRSALLPAESQDPDGHSLPLHHMQAGTNYPEAFLSQSRPRRPSALLVPPASLPLSRQLESLRGVTPKPMLLPAMSPRVVDARRSAIAA